MTTPVVEPARLKELNSAPERSGDYVLYWMQQSQRAEFNPALETAIGFANRLGLPVLVGFGLTDNYPEANARHYAFMLEGLREVCASLVQRGIGFVALRGSPDEVAISLAARAALVVCDRGYLRHQKAWRARVGSGAGCRVVQAEGDIVVPVELVSDKREAGARTLRPKLLRLRDAYLNPPPPTPVAIRADQLTLPQSIDLSNPHALLASLSIDHRVGPVARFYGGTTEAERRLRIFLHGPLQHYAGARGEPAAEQVSFLGAYLHFGQISPVRIALAVSQAEADQANRAAYLEELIVRRELAINFVEYEPNYDQYSCLPQWARQTLHDHRADPRPHCYSQEELALGNTHDRYWNAAMQEMRLTGYMHNHMRMYWGKKILEWSPSPEEAFATALALNNRYFLCGRDPNSYANIAWCFGLHDRPWPERPVFGKVRSMTAAGLRRKADIEAYVSRVSGLEELACGETTSGPLGQQDRL
ncbi:MAG: deoxyribodipyrimidine photo-lyase [Acetobacteraceae bacterium]|nr:deoxyribodipyrimidine photo-lyase [Acetobacteraceae bacterium]